MTANTLPCRACGLLVISLLSPHSTLALALIKFDSWQGIDLKLGCYAVGLVRVLAALAAVYIPGPSSLPHPLPRFRFGRLLQLAPQASLLADVCGRHPGVHRSFPGLDPLSPHLVMKHEL